MGYLVARCMLFVSHFAPNLVFARPYMCLPCHFVSTPQKSTITIFVWRNFPAFSRSSLTTHTTCQNDEGNTFFFAGRP